MARITKAGVPVLDLDHWGQIAGPKSDKQWVQGRSAMEAARYWLASEDQFPDEISACFSNHAAFGPILDWSAEPEVRLPFDEYKGEPRNTDLLVLAEDTHGPLLIAVEAKADECFSNLVPDQLAEALEARLENSRSMALARVEDLVKGFLPPATRGVPRLNKIRYQLLTAAAGAIAEAGRRSIGRAVLLVQEFRTHVTKDDAHALNQADIDAFVRRLSSGAVVKLEPGQVAGPFHVPAASNLSSQPLLYLAKIHCDLR